MLSVWCHHLLFIEIQTDLRFLSWVGPAQRPGHNLPNFQPEAQGALCRLQAAGWCLPVDTCALCVPCALCNHCKDQVKWCWCRSGQKGSTATIKLKVELIKVQSGGGEHLLQSLCFNHTDVGGGLHILTIGPNCLALPFTQLANAMQCNTAMLEIIWCIVISCYKTF